MHIADIEYSCNGLRLVGQIAVDDSRDGKRPAVLVAHEGKSHGPVKQTGSVCSR